MKIKDIYSHDDLLKNLKKGEKSYLLLYKKNSNLSDCAYTNLEKAINEFDELNIFSGDVTEVKDVHTKYQITTAPSLLIFEGKEFKKAVKGCNSADYYKALFESALFFALQKKSGNSQKNVTVYTTPTCSWCNTLKSHLKKNHIYFTEVDISSDPKLAEELVRKSGQQGFPQTEIDGSIIVGFDKTRINSLLNIKS